MEIQNYRKRQKRETKWKKYENENEAINFNKPKNKYIRIHENPYTAQPRPSGVLVRAAHDWKAISECKNRMKETEQKLASLNWMEWQKCLRSSQRNAKSGAAMATTVDSRTTHKFRIDAIMA